MVLEHLGSGKDHVRFIVTLASSMEVPPTPIIPHGPKVSWFNQLFNFKAETTVLSTSLSYEAAQTQLIAIFDVNCHYLIQQCEVKYQTRKDGGLKCKSGPTTIDDSNSASASLTIKFKVETMPDPNNNGGSNINFTYQQGAFPIFQELMQRVRTKWETLC